MDKVQDLVTAGENTYTNAQLTIIVYDLIFSTGIHNNACKEWLCLLPVNCIWATFKPHFTEAHKLLHEMQTSAARA
eukprot:14502531-Ditylum_brightwellii.AAC.1